MKIYPMTLDGTIHKDYDVDVSKTEDRIEELRMKIYNAKQIIKTREKTLIKLDEKKKTPEIEIKMHRAKKQMKGAFEDLKKFTKESDDLKLYLEKHSKK